MDVLAKAVQALVNTLGTKYGVALALVNRETREVTFAITDDLTRDDASMIFQMAGEESHVTLDRQM